MPTCCPLVYIFIVEWCLGPSRSYPLFQNFGRDSEWGQRAQGDIQGLSKGSKFSRLGLSGFTLIPNWYKRETGKRKIVILGQRLFIKSYYLPSLPIRKVRGRRAVSLLWADQSWKFDLPRSIWKLPKEFELVSVSYSSITLLWFWWKRASDQILPHTQTFTKWIFISRAGSKQLINPSCKPGTVPARCAVQ